MSYVVPSTNGIYPGQKYLVVGSTGDITYNSIVYNIGDVVVGVAVYNDYVVNSGDAYLIEHFELSNTAIEVLENDREEFSLGNIAIELIIGPYYTTHLYVIEF